MKCLFFIASLLLLGSSSATRFDDDLREFVEYVKLQMPCGFPSFGIPPLAPYASQFKAFDFTNKGVDLKGNLTNLSVNGLNDFDITELAYSTALFRLKFNFTFNQIKIFSQYIARGGLQIVGLPLPLNGNGNLDLVIEELRFSGSFRIRPTTSNGLQIFAFNCNLELNKVQSKTTGINNSPIFSQIFNDIVEEFFKLFFEDYQNEINDKISGFIVPNVNSLVNEVSMVELMALIFGLAPESDLPICEI